MLFPVFVNGVHYLRHKDTLHIYVLLLTLPVLLLIVISLANVANVVIVITVTAQMEESHTLH